MALESAPVSAWSERSSQANRRANASQLSTVTGRFSSDCKASSPRRHGPCTQPAVRSSSRRVAGSGTPRRRAMKPMKQAMSARFGEAGASGALVSKHTGMFLPRRSGHDLHGLRGEDDLLHGDVAAALSGKGGPGVLHGDRTAQHPGLDGFLRFVVQGDGHGLLRGGAVDARLAYPFPQRLGIHEAALQGGVARRVDSGDLAGVVFLFVAVAVFGHLDLGTDAGDVGKAAEDLAAVEIDQIVEGPVGRGAVSHGCSPRLDRRDQDRASAVFWPMRKMTNSAGLMMATPIRQTRRPLSRSF